MGIGIATADDYYHQLHQLLPTGPAWLSDDKLLRAVAACLSRTHNRALDLISNADVRTANELFPDWEYVAGLPDPCVTSNQSLGQRRASLLAKITAVGGQSITFYLNFAAALGYTITITEFQEHSVDDDVDAAVNGPDWAFTWQVTAPQNLVTEMTVDDSVDDALAAWGDNALECSLSRLKPANTHLIFAYI